ncbi:MAG: hypothetical protein Q7S87_08905 [Agitococcus sp.]|nr:hypothetical protein [Agitococcus sp.]MDO9177019.1 hypothetical protein [Agitococcus sp.]
MLALSLNTGPAYLVELINPVTKEIEEADVCRELAVALDKVYAHLAPLNALLTDVEVSFDTENEVEGIGFFDENRVLISCITTYHLARDTDRPINKAIILACAGLAGDLQQTLTHIFKSDSTAS